MNVPLVAEARQVVRPVCISIAGMAVLVFVIGTWGWGGQTLLVAALAAGIAGALVFQVHRAVTHLDRRGAVLAQAAQEAERHYVDVLLRVVRFVEQRDRYALGRSERIGRLSASMARSLGLPQQTCDLMDLAGQLHDIGLMAVPESILSKRSSLGDKELGAVRRHCGAALEMLSPLKMLQPVLPAIRWHHERMNGSGYPDAIKADAIPLEARILAVADSYDAMTHDRPHRPALTPLAAIRELQRCSPEGYDPKCVAALAELVNLPALEMTAK
jgi:HD-GYP domain-containing protein (c-di-GMP phosphodiesterase class II)